MEFRSLKTDDLPDLVAFMRRSIITLGPRHYPVAAMAAWADEVAKLATDDAPRVFDGRWTCLVHEGESIMGYVDLTQTGYLDFFFVAPEAAGTGLAQQLLDQMFIAAKAMAVPEITVEASHALIGLLTRHGFETVKKNTFEAGGHMISNHSLKLMGPF